MCVLVVEDDATLGSVYISFLKRLGLNADLVTSGADAIEQFKNFQYGLVLMDLGLPDKSGIETSHAIRELEQDVPIVALTAGHASRKECLKAGMNDYFLKPVLIDQFSGIVEKFNIGRCPRTSPRPA
jgi:DNA-binding response OmpR family regulator